MIQESAVVRVVRGFKAAILAREAAQMAILADRYLQLELSLEDTITALSEQVARLESEGRATYWAIQKLETYQRYQLKLLAELDAYNAWAAESIRAGQVEMAGLGAEHARAAVRAARPGIGFSPMELDEEERLIAMAGYASDGSPLSMLLSQSGDFIKQQVQQSLMNAILKSQNPRVTAREIRRNTGMALNRALAISRTEQMRVYRESTAAGYKANGVQLMQRLAARDPATCIGCLSMDGEISTTDASVDDHVCGRCTSVPYFGEGQSEMESAKSWFDRQPPETQRAMMGDTRYDLYKSGEAKWSDLGQHTHDPVWGGGIRATPAKDLPGYTGRTRTNRPEPRGAAARNVEKMTLDDALKEQDFWDSVAGFDPPGRGEITDEDLWKPVDAKKDIQKALSERLRGNADFDRLARNRMIPRTSKEAKIFDALPDDAARLNYAREQVVKELIDNWAETSGDGNAIACALQRAASHEFKLEKAAFGHLSDFSAADIARLGDTEDLSGLRAFLRAMHGETQDYFAARGITSVTAYRGTREGLIDGFGRVRVTMQPMSSFSTAFNTAVEFADGSSIIAMRVPVNRIIGTCRTGFGCLNERELIVLGGEHSAAAVNLHRWSSGKLWATLWRAMRGESG
jgi:SPP1 gp7 family putative phage head morphogenesis protein